MSQHRGQLQHKLHDPGKTSADTPQNLCQVLRSCCLVVSTQDTTKHFISLSAFTMGKNKKKGSAPAGNKGNKGPTKRRNERRAADNRPLTSPPPLAPRSSSPENSRSLEPNQEQLDLIAPDPAPDPAEAAVPLAPTNVAVPVTAPVSHDAHAVATVHDDGAPVSTDDAAVAKTLKTPSATRVQDMPWKSPLEALKIASAERVSTSAVSSVKAETVESDDEDDDVVAAEAAPSLPVKPVVPPFVTPMEPETTDAPSRAAFVAAAHASTPSNENQFDPALPAKIEEIAQAAVDLSLASAQVNQLQRVAAAEIKRIAVQLHADVDLPGCTANEVDKELAKLLSPKLVDDKVVAAVGDGIHSAVGAQMDMWICDKLAAQTQALANGIFDQEKKRIDAIEQRGIQRINEAADQRIAQDFGAVQERVDAVLADARAQLKQDFDRSLTEVRDAASTVQTELDAVTAMTTSFEQLHRSSVEEFEQLAGSASGLLDRTPITTMFETQRNELEDTGVPQRNKLVLLGNQITNDLTGFHDLIKQQVEHAPVAEGAKSPSKEDVNKLNARLSDMSKRIDAKVSKEEVDVRFESISAALAHKSASTGAGLSADATSAQHLTAQVHNVETALELKASRASLDLKASKLELQDLKHTVQDLGVLVASSRPSSQTPRVPRMVGAGAPGDGDDGDDEPHDDDVQELRHQGERSVSGHKLFPDANAHGPLNVKGFSKLNIELPSLDKKAICNMCCSLQTSSEQCNMLLRRWEDIEKDRSLFIPAAATEQRKAMSAQLHLAFVKDGAPPAEAKNRLELHACDCNGHKFLHELLRMAHKRLSPTCTTLSQPTCEAGASLCGHASDVRQFIMQERTKDRNCTACEETLMFLETINSPESLNESMEHCRRRVRAAEEAKMPLPPDMAIDSIAAAISHLIPGAGSANVDSHGVLHRTVDQRNRNNNNADRSRDRDRDRTSSKPHSRLTDVQCDGCGCWGHAADMCNIVARHVAAKEHCDKHPAEAKKLARDWKQRNSRENMQNKARDVRAKARSLHGHGSADEKELIDILLDADAMLERDEGHQLQDFR